ncbi:bifunctional DNA primase/helicase, partial [Butyrivibrio sp. WCD2001]|uniref:bifunctional DNA primase/helicase n=1 Tax=Butyrivibrio sp. WCD2001 TaxID=1280681 RepID=UPI000677DE04
DAAYNTFNVDDTGQQSFSKWRVLIIPTGKGSFIARNIDTPKEPVKKNRYRKKGANVIFNSKALYTANKPIFVVEGELDALSVIEAGGEAIGLGSTSNYAQLINLLKAKQAVQPLILALDADEEGRKTEEKLAEELTALQASFYRYNLYGAAKDANEALLLDREGFISEVASAERAKEAELEAMAEAAKEDYLKTSAAHELQNFLGGITDSADTPALSTGFKILDHVLDGGLYEGLYIIGAISSLGKTTLALQIVDQLAQQGQDCLVFSLEMARSELIAKSISRLTFLAAERKADAKTTRGITAGARWKSYSDTEKALINKAMQTYKDFAQHIYIHEGVGDIGIQQVADTVKQHIAITGNKPVVLIDYLQILAPYDMRASDKQNTDKATLELKRLSRDCKIPVIGISSFNRDNYTAPVNNASFKESGAIEYSADVLIGLQYEGMDYQEGETDNARQKRIRELIKNMEEKARTGEAQTLQAKVLKNRNGSKGQAEFSFYAMFNCFEEYEPDFEPVEKDSDVFSGMTAK